MDSILERFAGEKKKAVCEFEFFGEDKLLLSKKHISRFKYTGIQIKRKFRFISHAIRTGVRYPRRRRNRHRSPRHRIWYLRISEQNTQRWIYRFRIKPNYQKHSNNLWALWTSIYRARISTHRKLGFIYTSYNLFIVIKWAFCIIFHSSFHS